MSKQQIQSVLDFYLLTSKLKNTIRSGWKLWKISAPRLESVAEHVYSTQMLAIAIISEYKLDIDLRKVVLMLAIHELGETVIGDITPWDSIVPEDKHKIEMDAVEKILAELISGDKIKDLYVEFEENNTAEAKFCKQVDKLEASLQAKQYDEDAFSDYTTPRPGKLEERRQYHIAKGNNSLGVAWVDNEIEAGIYADEFLELAEYIRDNKLKEEK
jgi:putative hydrolase of HD superfamily